jgi:hypothetical protein
MSTTRLAAWLLAFGLALGITSPVSAQLRPRVTQFELPDINTVLLVGNSYAYSNGGLDGMLGGLYQSAFPERPEMIVLMALISSAQLSWHDVESYFRPHAIGSWRRTAEGEYVKPPPSARLFDVVILQDCSVCMTAPQLRPDFFAAVNEDVAIVRRHGAVPVLFMTWPDGNRPELLRVVSDAVTQAGNDNNTFVVPVALAFERINKDRPNIKLYGGDQGHPSNEGSYLAACTMFAALFHRSPAGVRFRSHVESKEVARRLQEAAWATVKDYYGWTDQ